MSDTHLPSELQTMLGSCKQCAFDIIEKSLQSKNNLRALDLSISKDICVLEYLWYFFISCIFNKKQKMSVLRIAL